MASADQPKVSVIIPLRKDQGYLADCVKGCLAQEGAELEVIVLPDDPLPSDDPRVRVIATGPSRPAPKRNRGAREACGEILAFIDDDTRPLPGWLSSALGHFRDPAIAAVGGPSVTPSDDPFWAQVSGAAYESWMLSGGERRRHVPRAAAEVHDWPSCNLLVRRSAFEAAGGFGTDFWPGEDTEFCLALVKKGLRIRYEPRAAIEHHRRPSLGRHFKQLMSYGLHRGYFAKRYPETSRRLMYFMPTLMVFGGAVLAAGALGGCAYCRGILAALVPLYFLLALLSLLGRPLKWILPAAALVFLSHIAYGLAFARGLLAPSLAEETEGKIKLRV